MEWLCGMSYTVAPEGKWDVWGQIWWISVAEQFYILSDMKMIRKNDVAIFKVLQNHDMQLHRKSTLTTQISSSPFLH